MIPKITVVGDDPVNSLPKEKDGGRFGFIVAIRSAASASAWFRGEGGKPYFDL